MTSAHEDILALERTVWEALKSGDPGLDAKMLSEDFLGVYPIGFSTKQQHCGQLRNGPTVASYELLDTRLVHLAKDLVLLAYRARWSRIRNGEPGEPEEMYISSIWKRSSGGWENIFSQDTPATA